MQNLVQSLVCAVCSRQTVMQKDSIEALHQNRNPLVQEAGLLSLARVFKDPPSKIIEEVTSWCVKNAQGLYRNWLKDVTSTEVYVFLLFASGCHLCCLLLLLLLLLHYCIQISVDTYTETLSYITQSQDVNQTHTLIRSQELLLANCRLRNTTGSISSDAVCQYGHTHTQQRSAEVQFASILTLWHPLLPYGYGHKASCARPG